MSGQNMLLMELEDAASHVATGKRCETLARVTDLFVRGSAQYSDEQIAIFDDVFNRFTVEIEVTARAMLANRLAMVPNAPSGTIYPLAFDDEIVVAGPVLIHSVQLNDAEASESVRKKLEATMSHASREIERVVSQVAGRIQEKTGAVSRDYVVAQTLVGSLQRSGQLGESHIEAFAKAGKFEETAAALAVLCGLSIASVEHAMTQDRPELVLIFAKASRLSWRTAKAILMLRAGDPGTAIAEIEHGVAIFERLKRATAEQALRFHQQRERAEMPRLN